MEAQAVETLKRRITAPEWLYRLALDTCAGSHTGAFHFVLWIQNRKIADEDRARLEVAFWQEDCRQGYDAAKAALQEKKVWEEATGDLSLRFATCPKCVARHDYSWTDPRELRCPACGAQAVETWSKKGLANPPFVAGWNAAMEEHLRATVNPSFRWDDVRDA